MAQVHEVMNEVVIDRGSSSFLTNIECYEKGRFITRVQADGIMLATPTGRLLVHALGLPLTQAAVPSSSGYSMFKHARTPR